MRTYPSSKCEDYEIDTNTIGYYLHNVVFLIWMKILSKRKDGIWEVLFEPSPKGRNGDCDIIILLNGLMIHHQECWNWGVCTIGRTPNETLLGRVKQYISTSKELGYPKHPTFSRSLILMGGHPNQPYMKEIEELFETYRHSKPIDEIPTHHQMRFLERVNDGIIKQLVMSVRVPSRNKSDYVPSPLRKLITWLNLTLYHKPKPLEGVKPPW